MATYYRKIKGKNYDKALLDAAEKSVKGRGDGRISLNDAKKILGMVKDAAGYTDTEKRTMQYIRDKFDFTPESDRWFRTEIRKWAAKKGTPAKSAKKPAAKKKAGKKPTPAPLPKEEPAVSGIAPPPSAHKPVALKQPSGGTSVVSRILVGILIIAVLFIIVMIISPTCREQVKQMFRPAVAPVQEQPAAQEQTIPDTKPAPEAPAEQVAPATLEEAGDVYVVQVKDDLVSISEKMLGDSKRWIDIFNANRDIIKNPTLIFPGQRLKMPPAHDDNK